MGELKKWLKENITSKHTFQIDFRNGFVVVFRRLLGDELSDIFDKHNINKDKRWRKEKELDNRAFTAEICEKLIVNWSGLTRAKMAKWASNVDIDDKKEIPFTVENAIDLCECFTDFRLFVANFATDLFEYESKQEKKAIENFDSTPGSKG